MENTKVKMRRRDREITDNEKIKEIIKACDCCRLGLNDNGKVYIVPLNFGYSNIDNKRIFYFICYNTIDKNSINLILI